MVFTVILGTLSWIPQLNTEPESSGYKSKFNLNSVNLKLPRDGDPPQFESNSVLNGLAKSEKENDQEHRALDRPVIGSPQVEGNNAAAGAVPGENPWEGLPLQKDSDLESNIQPVPPKDLLPDSGDDNAAVEQSVTKHTTTVGSLRGLKV